MPSKGSDRKMTLKFQQKYITMWRQMKGMYENWFLKNRPAEIPTIKSTFKTKLYNVDHKVFFRRIINFSDYLPNLQVSTWACGLE